MTALVTATRLDRALAHLAPGWAARRLRARAAFLAMAGAGGHTGGRRDRRSMESWKPSAGSADADLLPDLATLRERSRDLARNAPLACGALKTVVTNVVGTGLRLQARVDRELLAIPDAAAERFERDAERTWKLWSETTACDVTRTQSFAGLQNMAFRAVLESGDVFLVKRMIARPGEALSYRLQFVEADRVSTPTGTRDGQTLANGNTVAGGVERDAEGAPVAYHVLEAHPGGLEFKTRKWQRIEAFGRRSGVRVVLHLFDRTRPGQARGVPYLAPVIESLKELDKYTEAERMAAVVASMFTVFVKSESGEDLAPVTPTAETGGSTSDTDYRLGSGALLSLAKGEDITIADPKRPNQAFDAFVQAILRQVASALELPFELVIKHFTASYSASRAALLEAWKFFRARRAWLAGELCQPVYEDVIAEAVGRGLLAAPGFEDPLLRRAWLGAEWIGPAAGQIDPLKEVEAADKRVQIGVSTLADEAAAISGGDFERIHAQRVKEEKMRRADGLAAAPPAGPANKMAKTLPAPDDGERTTDDGEEKPDEEKEAA